MSVIKRCLQSTMLPRIDGCRIKVVINKTGFGIKAQIFLNENMIEI